MTAAPDSARPGLIAHAGNPLTAPELPGRRPHLRQRAQRAAPGPAGARHPPDDHLAGVHRQQPRQLRRRTRSKGRALRQRRAAEPWRTSGRASPLLRLKACLTAGRQQEARPVTCPVGRGGGQAEDQAA